MLVLLRRSRRSTQNDQSGNHKLHVASSNRNAPSKSSQPSPSHLHPCAKSGFYRQSQKNVRIGYVPSA
jgi:hypothetical protein